MIRTISTSPEILGVYQTAQKVVFLVITAGTTIYVATSRYELLQSISGVPQGTPIASTDGKIALDVLGEIWWVATAKTQVDIFESGAI